MDQRTCCFPCIVRRGSDSLKIASAALARLAQQANQEKQAINTETGPCADRLLKAWQSWWQIFKQGEYKATDHGEIALESLSAAHEVYLAYCNTLSRGSPTEAFDPVPLLSEAASTAHLRPAGITHGLHKIPDTNDSLTQYKSKNELLYPGLGLHCLSSDTRLALYPQ